MLHAQSTTKPTVEEQRDKYGTDCAYANFFAGPAASVGGTATRESVFAGVTFGQYFAAPLGKGLGATPQFELGAVGPLPGGHRIDGTASVNYAFINKIPRREMYPSLALGYTRFFVTGNAVNFGAAFDFARRANSDALWRIEVKDYYLFTGPQQHVLSVRLGFGKLIAD